MFASVMISCGGSADQKPATDSTTSQTTTPTEATTPTATASTTPANAWACEMKCEGEGKTYTEVGKCPKCSKDLMPVTTTTK